MPAPRYTPTEGIGANYTDEQGNSYQFNGRTWEQISTGAYPTESSYTSESEDGESGPTGGGYSLKEYFGGKDTEAYRRYKEGQREGKWEDLPDFVAQGGDNSGRVTGPGDVIDDIMESQEQIIEDEIGWLEEYTEENPFVFDEELAKESATAEYTPYYNELLDDYLQDIESKRETVQDEEQLAQDLYQNKSESYERSYRQAEEQARQGHAGTGMFYSGVKKRELGRGEVEYGAKTERRQAKREFGQRETERELSGLERSAQRKERDIERKKKAAIESGVLKRQSEAEKQYRIGLQQAYHRRFPSSSGSALQGYVVPEFLRY